MESEMKDNILMVLVGALAVMSLINVASVFALNQQIELLNSNFLVLNKNLGVQPNQGQGELQPSASNPAQPSQPTQPSAVQVSADDDAVLGDPNAPIEIIEFSDYECPFCSRFYTNTLPEIKEKYIDTGKAKLVYRDFPLSFHPDAQKAAEATECADDQGKFWEMHDKLFSNQSAIGVSDLKGYAKDLGLNSSEFDTCLDSGKYASEVQKDFRDGQSAGVSGTPTFYINGVELVGAQAFPAFEEIIEAQLAEVN